MTTKQGIVAQQERDRRRSEACRDAIKPPTVEDLRELTAERDAARAATAELAEVHQRVCAERDELRRELKRRAELRGTAVPA